MIIKIENQEQWKTLRRQHVGGSEIATLFGESPFMTPNQLYHLKRGNLQDVDESPLMEFGRLMEPVIAYLVTEHHQWRMIRCEEYHQHPIYPWLGCTLDYYCEHPEYGEGIMQIKNVQNFAPGWTQNRAPAHVELQVQHELFVTNAARKWLGMKPFRWCAIVSLHSGNPEDLRVMFREQDSRVTKHIVDRSKRFWSDMLSANEPPIVGAEDYDHIADLFRDAPELPPEYMDFTGDKELESWAFQLVGAKTERRAAEYTEKDMRVRILNKMMVTTPQPGRMTVAHTGKVSVTAKVNAAGHIRLDVETLEDEKEIPEGVDQKLSKCYAI